MEFNSITDTGLFNLSGTKFIENPHLFNEKIISALSNSGLSVSEILRGGFSTPKNIGVGPMIGGWYKDYSSGRSFQASFKEADGTITTFVNKGNDIFEGDRYRRYHKEDGTYVGQELFGFLRTEFIISTRIQEQALQQLGRITYTTIPLSLSIIEKTLAENGTVIDYGDYFRKVLSEYPEYKEGLIRMLLGIGILSSEEFLALFNISHDGKKATINTVKLFDFMEKYPMGTYMYLIKGMNTRIIEHRKIGKNRLEVVIREEYPNCISQDGNLDKVKVLEEFCRRLGENLGITYSSGLTYKRKSRCVLIDTTLGGISMDNGHIGEGIEVENVISRLSELFSTIYFFNEQVLEGKAEDTERVFRDFFIPEVIKKSGKNSELIQQHITGSSLPWTELSQSFYMVNDFGNVRKMAKKASIIGIGSSTIHLPLIKRLYYIEG